MENVQPVRSPYLINFNVNFATRSLNRMIPQSKDVMNAEIDLDLHLTIQLYNRLLLYPSQSKKVNNKYTYLMLMIKNRT